MIIPLFYLIVVNSFLFALLGLKFILIICVVYQVVYQLVYRAALILFLLFFRLLVLHHLSTDVRVLF